MFRNLALVSAAIALMGSPALSADHVIAAANTTTVDVVDISTIRKVGCTISPGEFGSCGNVIRLVPLQESARQAWTTRIVRHEPKYAKIYYQKILQEYECDRRQIRTIDIISYSESGEVTERSQGSGGYSHAVPGSFGEAALEVVCNMVNLHPDDILGNVDPIPSAEGLIARLRKAGS